MKLIPGWYAAWDSKEFKQNKITSGERFGIPLVGWRTKAGGISILKDLCPHRSAKLSLGILKDDELACPFHGFRFDIEGKCTLIPEIKRGSDKVCTEHFLTQEKHGFIWIFYGPKEQASQTQIPWFTELDQRFTHSQMIETWDTHFTRSVENQLDYAHLPYVHRTTIGKFADPNKTPVMELTDERIRWGFDPNNRTNGYIEFLFPNVWVNRLGDKFSITLAFVPVNETTTRLYLRTYRRFAKLPIIGHLVGWALNLSNRFILNQDHDVVMSQKPINALQAPNEILVGSDAAIRHFRKQTEKLGV
ncbi:MAG: aromatic ring-hydroxylating dioxygenase subunit alpha [Xanthomonadaceae bacterium]|nr:aromatic ring-hydroxylating dioxygenase subunit alpha [Xanthomonadaceae bacterium]